MRFLMQAIAHNKKTSYLCIVKQETTSRREVLERQKTFTAALF